ncbi:MAG TPA: hypothetical protein VHV10_08405 [Ktedonobacteraceae bacterium]|nr:hypothetical protein [Ktedonobacteraceae bacterium]
MDWDLPLLCLSLDLGTPSSLYSFLGYQFCWMKPLGNGQALPLGLETTHQCISMHVWQGTYAFGHIPFQSRAADLLLGIRDTSSTTGFDAHHCRTENWAISHV